VPDQAETIDGVVTRLGEIVEQSKSQESRLGYFPALYRKVTVRVKERVEAGGYFDDDERMERLDVVFANRYLDAFADARAGVRPTASWELAFGVSGEWWPIVLQHLLLGMNAHINLDLGIAAVQTAGPSGLHALRADFDRINALLGSLVGEVMEELAWVWPPLRVVNRMLGSVDDAIVDFSMKAARDSAWAFAEELAPKDDEGRANAIARRDREVLERAGAIRHPGIIASTIAGAVRLGERGSVARIIRQLE